MSNFAISFSMQDYKANEIMAAFDNCFLASHNTRLIKGDDEPLYQPADHSCQYHQVIFAHGYASSALHEAAHWCLAGEQRRTQVDYGYWYNADGRNKEQQKAFEQVEVKPQAIEWILSETCSLPFRVSCDNLQGDYTDPLPFKKAVYEQILNYCEHGLPERAEQFRLALADYFQKPKQLTATNFSLDAL